MKKACPLVELRGEHVFFLNYCVFVVKTAGVFHEVVPKRIFLIQLQYKVDHKKYSYNFKFYKPKKPIRENGK
jgi:hypothetical protein